MEIDVPIREAFVCETLIQKMFCLTCFNPGRIRTHESLPQEMNKIDISIKRKKIGTLVLRQCDANRGTRVRWCRVPYPYLNARSLTFV